MRKCTCCKQYFDPNDDRETHNGGCFGESVCFECYNGDKDGCDNCQATEDFITLTADHLYGPKEGTK